MGVLTGCVVCLCGLGLGKKKQELMKLVKDSGAEHSYAITKKTTHVVTTAEEVAKSTYSIREAIKLGLPIITENFLLDCVANGRKEDEAPYLLVHPEDAEGGPPAKKEGISSKKEDSGSDGDFVVVPQSSPPPQQLKSQKVNEFVYVASDSDGEEHSADAEESVRKEEAQPQPWWTPVQVQQAQTPAPSFSFGTLTSTNNGGESLFSFGGPQQTFSFSGSKKEAEPMKKAPKKVAASPKKAPKEVVASPKKASVKEVAKKQKEGKRKEPEPEPVKKASKSAPEPIQATPARATASPEEDDSTWSKYSYPKVGASPEGSKNPFPKEYEIFKRVVLQVTDVKTNNNKYYSLELHTAEEGGKKYYRLFSHYGRTDDLQSNPNAGRKESRYHKTLEDAKGNWAALMKDKTSAKKGYKKINLFASNIGSEKARGQATTVQDIPPPVSSHSQLPKGVQELVKHFFEEATNALTSSVAAQITARGIETPLGILSMDQIQKGEDILAKVARAIKTGETSKQIFEDLSNQFFTQIPHKIGRSKQAVQSAIIQTPAVLEQKQELLQLMKDMLTVNSNGSLFFNEVDMKYRALRCTIDEVDSNSAEYSKIKNYVLDAQVKSKDMKVVNIFTVKRGQEQQAFTHSLHNQQLLFHGSRVSNFIGLLSRGILLPKAVMGLGGKRTNFGWLGAGIYFGSASCTATMYTVPGSKGTRFMIVCCVALGDVKDYTKITPELEAAPSGYHSVHGVRRTPFLESDFSEDEWVIYSTSQQMQQYIVEFSASPISQNELPSSAPSLQLAEPKPKAQKELKPQKAPAQTEPKLKSPKKVTMDSSPARVKTFKKQELNISSPYEFSIDAPDINQFAHPSAYDPNQFASTVDYYAPQLSYQQNNQPEYAPYSFSESVQEPEVGLHSSNVYSEAEYAPYSFADSYIEPSTDESSGSGSLLKRPPLTDELPRNLQEMKDQEDRLRGFYAQNREHPEIQDLFCNLVDVYSNRETFQFSQLDEGERGIPQMLNLVSKQREGPSVVSKEQYMKNWEEFTAGQFRGFDWSNVFVAGGSVLACMLGFDSKHYETGSFRNSDIDLFVYGLNPAQANEKLKQMYEQLCKNTSNSSKIIRTKHAVTIINPFPFRHTQIVLRLYKSPAEVLMGFDIDSVTVGFDGQRVWALPRARRAINKGYNLVDMSRRSLTYEVRLFKYSKRGFAVAIPAFDRSKVDPSIFQKTAKDAKGLAKLLIYEHNMINAKKKTAAQPRNKTKVSMKGAPETVEDGEDESDYSDVGGLPWGPDFMPGEILKFLDGKDKAQFFSKEKVTHSHIFVSGIEGVLGGKSSWCKICKEHTGFGPLTWLIENPGRQLLTGSFHPVSDEEWDREAYLGSERVKVHEMCNAAYCGDVTILREKIYECASFSASVNSVNYRGWAPLHYATSFGHMECIRALVSNGADVNLRQAMCHSFSPLHFAAYNGSKEIVQFLLDSGAEVNARSSQEMIPLAVACYYGNVECAKILISRGSNLHTKDAKGRTPLWFAAFGNMHQLIELLLRDTPLPGASDSQFPLQIAARKGNVEFVNKYCEIAKISAPKVAKKTAPVVRYPVGDEFPLGKAISESDMATVKSLLASADIRATDRFGASALHIAAHVGNLEAIQLLLRNGAKIDAKDTKDLSSLHYAARSANVESVQLLLESGANINQLSCLEMTPLHFCLAALGSFSDSNPDIFNCGPATERKENLEKVKNLLLKHGAKHFGLSAYPLPVLPKRIRSIKKLGESPSSSSEQSPQDSPTRTPIISRSPSPAISPRSPAVPASLPGLLAEWTSKPLKTTLSKILLLLSLLYQRANITKAERGALKDAALQDSTILVDAMNCFELDGDVPELIDTLKLIVKQSGVKEPVAPQKVARPLFSNPSPKKPTKSASPNLGLSWQQQGSVLILDSPEIQPSSKVVAFDMDGTLIQPKSGQKFPKDEDDWVWLSGVKEQLIDLHDDGIKLVIFSNQGGISKGNQNPEHIKNKIIKLCKELGFPLQAFIATKKDLYRKPNPSMWTLFTSSKNGSVKVDMETAVFVGDAAGRAANWKYGAKKDISCSDRAFASNIGVKFQTPEEFFFNELPAPFQWDSIDPVEYLNKAKQDSSQFQSMAASEQEMVVFVGVPASGKSTFALNYFVSRGYAHINQDTLKTKAKCVSAASEAVASGKSVVIDNTNPSAEDRGQYIAIAKSHNIPARCLILQTDIRLAHHLNVYREKISESRIAVPDIAYNMFKSKYQEPQMEEGFAQIKRIDFVPTFQSEEHRKLFLQRT